MTYSEKIKQGEFIQIRRGREWALIQPFPEYNENNERTDWSATKVTWIYGTGKTGTDRCICPLDVLDSQLQAHVDHGWKIIK